MDKKKTEKKLVIIALILLLIIILELIILINRRNSEVLITNGTTSKQLSSKQVDLSLRNFVEENDNAYTEIQGYGLITINSKNPYLYLTNPETNNVYLSFDVTYADNVLYSSGLIEPGKMEQFDIYSCLDAGKHTLIYSINSYDLDTKEIYWSGIKQEQEIYIK